MHDLLHTQAHRQNSRNQLTYVPPTSRSHRLGWRIQVPVAWFLTTTFDSALNNARLLSVRKCLIKTRVAALTETATENHSLYSPFTGKSSDIHWCKCQLDSTVASHRSGSVTWPWHEQNPPTVFSSETHEVVCALHISKISYRYCTNYMSVFPLLKSSHQAGILTELEELEEAARPQWGYFAY